MIKVVNPPKALIPCSKASKARKEESKRRAEKKKELLLAY